MKQILLLLIVLLFSDCTSKQSEKAPKDKEPIVNTITSFLKWHKKGGQYKTGEYYFIIRHDGTGKLKNYFDKDSISLYYKNFLESGFVSETYIEGLKGYHNYYEQFLPNKLKKGELIKIDGLDQDDVLGTFEPEMILDNLDKLKVTQMLVIYNKALVGINFDKNVDMIFQLTKTKDKWLIDYVGPNNSNEHSFFRQ